MPGPLVMVTARKPALPRPLLAVTSKVPDHHRDDIGQEVEVHHRSPTLAAVEAEAVVLALIGTDRRRFIVCRPSRLPICVGLKVGSARLRRLFNLHNVINAMVEVPKSFQRPRYGASYIFSAGLCS